MTQEQTRFRSLTELPRDRHVVTIGSFDGVHRGHQHLISKVVEHAGLHQVRSLAITFDPLPAEVLRPDHAPPRVCTTEARTTAMLKSGLDRVAILTFDQHMANQSAGDFLSDLVAAAQPVAIIVGEDFAFGHKRQGTPAFLQTNAVRYGYTVTVVPRINPVEQLEWSSSFIRRVISEDGDVRSAAASLGRLFHLSGTVTGGDRRGRDLGYPTANLIPPVGLVIPADGIYAALVDIENQPEESDLPCLVYVGRRPTFEGNRRVIEVFILDFDSDLYDREITVRFIERVRRDRAFDSPEELVEQMHRDESDGRRILSEFGANVTITPGN